MLYFQHHDYSLQCHMIFRNHNNMLIYNSETVVLLNIHIFYGTCDTFFFDSLINKKFKLFKNINIFFTILLSIVSIYVT